MWEVATTSGPHGADARTAAATGTPAERRVRPDAPGEARRDRVTRGHFAPPPMRREPGGVS